MNENTITANETQDRKVDFSAGLQEVRKIVAAWPAWKRNILGIPTKGNGEEDDEQSDKKILTD